MTPEKKRLADPAAAQHGQPSTPQHEFPLNSKGIPATAPSENPVEATMCGDRPVICWTKPMLERFKVAHKTAVNIKADTFVFDGNEFVVGYAKYLIEYLDAQLPSL